MNRDVLFRWMAKHRTTPGGCDRCGRPNVVYFRDHAERTVCFGCCIDAVAYAREQAAADNLPPGLREAITRRLADLTRDDR